VGEGDVGVDEGLSLAHVVAEFRGVWGQGEQVEREGKY